MTLRSIHPLAAPVLAAGSGKPFIDWAALGKVAGVSFVFGLGIITLFSVALVGISWMNGHHEPGQRVDHVGTVAVSGNRTLGAVVALTCLAGCVAAVLFGLWLIVPQFH